MSKLFTCDACYRMFWLNSKPEICPKCKRVRITRTMDTGAAIQLPVVRPANPNEIDAYTRERGRAVKKTSTKDKMDSLRNYEMTNDEYHTALMLLYLLRTTPAPYVGYVLKDILQSHQGKLDDHEIELKQTEQLYSGLKRCMRSDIAEERRNVGA